MAAGRFEKELLSSLVADIKTYDGSDPLRPWLQGIRRMKASLPPQILKEKLPRFLQKCAEALECDRRYRNDPRYLRVWIELMDYVNDAKPILGRMEKNGIGLKRAAFYLAYAIYYEKQKKFDEADKMYHVGVQNLAEPVAELHKSYEQFLRRMELYKKRKTKVAEMMLNTGKGSYKSMHDEKNNTGNEETKQIEEQRNHQISGTQRNSQKLHCNTNNATNENLGLSSVRKPSNHSEGSDVNSDKCFNDETVVVKFVDSAIVGKSEAEDACHHGLVDPTINMKEAMNAISSMFKVPLEPETILKRRSNRSKSKANQQSSGFEVFVDDDGSSGGVSNSCSHNAMFEQNYAGNPFKNQHHRKHETSSGEFKILADDDEELGMAIECSNISAHPKPNRPDSESCKETVFHEETVFHKFVGSTVFGESKVENACHHGLIDPTINLKEAMDDINSMFGKPLDFKGEKPKKKQDRAPAIDHKLPNDGFSILADVDIEDPKGKASLDAANNFGNHSDLFEPTMFTKEAMDEINSLFGKPLDF